MGLRGMLISLGLLSVMSAMLFSFNYMMLIHSFRKVTMDMSKHTIGAHKTENEDKRR
jgi:hypothetical protein